jgi:hypothetical protein
VENIVEIDFQCSPQGVARVAQPNALNLWHPTKKFFKFNLKNNNDLVLLPFKTISQHMAATQHSRVGDLELNFITKTNTKFLIHFLILSCGESEE